jgi:hypothetical protein
MRSARADTEQRRHKVAELWLRGISVRSIAEQVHVSPTTVATDLTAVRAELLREHRQELEAKRARSVAHLRAVQASAWTLFARLKDDRTNKVGSLNTIVNAEQLITKLEGTAAPDTAVNLTVAQIRVANDALERAASDPEVAAHVGEILARLTGPGTSPAPSGAGGHRERWTVDGSATPADAR